MAKRLSKSKIKGEGRLFCLGKAVFFGKKKRLGGRTWPVAAVDVSRREGSNVDLWAVWLA